MIHQGKSWTKSDISDMLTLSLPESPAAERQRSLRVTSLRMQALERLYQRRAAVDNLISAFERYQDHRADEGSDPVSVVSD
jgi:hypothetical protein